MQHSVVIRCSKKKKKAAGEFLRRYGLLWTGDSYIGNIYYDWDYENIEDFCKMLRLRLREDNQFAVRGKAYRAHFFQAYPPHVGNRYFCAYCGRLLPRKRVTVDHLYPIGSAKKNIRLQRKLRRMGIRNINDTRNLVASCKACNQHKGKKMGLWIVKGRIGRHPRIWLMRYAGRVALLLTIMWVIYAYVL